MRPLSSSLADFIEAYRRHAKLVAEQRDWSTTIALVASDSGDAVAIRLRNGDVVDVHDRCAEGDVIVTSDAATLRDILELRRGPNEPYLFGELTVQGPEADFLRLDYIISVLCPS